MSFVLKCSFRNLRISLIELTFCSLYFKLFGTFLIGTNGVNLSSNTDSELSQNQLSLESDHMITETLDDIDLVVEKFNISSIILLAIFLIIFFSLSNPSGVRTNVEIRQTRKL